MLCSDACANPDNLEIRCRKWNTRQYSRRKGGSLQDTTICRYQPVQIYRSLFQFPSVNSQRLSFSSYLSIYLSIYLSMTFFFISICIYLSKSVGIKICFHLSYYLSILLSIYLTLSIIYLSIYLYQFIHYVSISVFIFGQIFCYLSYYNKTNKSVCLSIYLSIYLSHSVHYLSIYINFFIMCPSLHLYSDKALSFLIIIYLSIYLSNNVLYLSVYLSIDIFDKFNDTTVAPFLGSFQNIAACLFHSVLKIEVTRKGGRRLLSLFL
ncbi:unnamed protein product [Acanthosepion pharaonis]|uniref:Uncharacterized protein n=1 Tax=Acanthosepion pharaonis TaxID=158019 RepID=A0A812AW53_ACAPH|nr:unnamed protein product [Sepia pharaonis]